MWGCTPSSAFLLTLAVELAEETEGRNNYIFPSGQGILRGLQIQKAWQGRYERYSLIIKKGEGVTLATLTASRKLSSG